MQVTVLVITSLGAPVLLFEIQRQMQWNRNYNVYISVPEFTGESKMFVPKQPESLDRFLD